MKNIVLVIDDDPVVRKLLREDLPGHGFEVLVCGTCKEGHAILREKPVQAIILDYRLPDCLGADFFRSAKDELANVPVIFITNFPDIEQAVQLIKEGAADYIVKPVAAGDVADRIRRALEVNNLRSEVTYHRRRSLSTRGELILIGSSKAMRNVRRAIQQAILSSSTPVLITGETGTGKEVVARLIHQGCHGDTHPFVEVDCAAISKALFESELFGHERGAFPGADQTREGIFELGKDGTIFLDEVAEIDLELQGKLLRVLETQQFRRVGGTHPLTFEARVIAASNRDLRALMQRNEFRADVFYRLAVYELKIPPLRERGDDIVELAEFFFKEALSRHGKSLRRLSKGFLEKLCKHAFPGNVRELRNLVGQAVIQTKAEEANLPGFTPQSSSRPEATTPDVKPGITLHQHESGIIESVLRQNRGNKAAAARQLGISRTAFLRRLLKIKSRG